MTEEIIDALAKIDGFRVVARTSSFAFKGKQQDIREIGKKLNVGAVLEGSVRKDGNLLRVTAQLNSVSDGYHLWSQTYERELKDVFAVQDEIAKAIVNTLQLKLATAQPKRAANVEAYLQEIALARAAVAGKELDDVVPSHGHHPERGRDIRWIYLHMIEEYARHNGHADLIRERIDGVTGG